MAEGCHTLAPERPVYLPNLQALCSLAEVDADDVAERQEFLRAAGRRFATMTYVNTYADVKALSDTCCTSSNAARIAGQARRPRPAVRPRPEPRLPGGAQHQADVPAAARAAQVPPARVRGDGRAADPRGRAAGAGRQRVRVGGRLPRPPPDDRRRHRAHPPRRSGGDRDRARRGAARAAARGRRRAVDVADGEVRRGAPGASRATRS